MTNGGLLESARRQSASDDGVWLSVSEIARLKGVEKSSVSRRLKRLIELGTIEAKPGPGGQKLVKLAAYDRAIGEVSESPDHSRTSDRPPSRGSGLAREQARRVAYQADLAELDLAERRAKTVPTEDIRLAVVRGAEKIVERLLSMPAMAERIADAVAQSGVQGARSALKACAEDLRAAIAEDFRPEATTADDEEERWPKPATALAELEAETEDRWRRLRTRTGGGA